MLQEFISVITSLGVSLQEFTYISIIGFVWYFPIMKLIKFIFGGVN